MPITPRVRWLSTRPPASQSTIVSRHGASRWRRTDDVPGMREVYLAAHRADGLDDAPSMEQFELNYSTLVNCDPTTDVLIAEVDGRQVAYGRVFWTDQVDGGRSYETFGFVHPDWRRRGIGEALAEAFRDHWGEPEWTDADWRRFEANPDHADPSLWRIAWDGDEVAGGVVTTVPAEENAEHGRARVYVAMVAIRRPWRRRGLARALLAESMIAAREAGFTSASLGVDAES